MLQGLTVRELREELEGKDDDLLVVVGVDYGDRQNTIQAIPATDCGTVTVSKSAYSDSGYKINDEEDERDGQQTALSLNFRSV